MAPYIELMVWFCPVLMVPLGWARLLAGALS